MAKKKYILGRNNRDYISYSSYNLWKSSKKQYRERYYLGIQMPQNAELIFGKKIGRYLEEDHPEVDHIEKYSVPEKKIELEIDGLKLLGYLDSYCPKEKAFLEYKTSHKNPQGMHSWNAVKVQRHEQLDFYSLLIQLKEGKVKDKCKLIYLETETNKINYHGRILEPIDKGLRLTGDVHVFERDIEQWERDLIKKKILQTANEIHKDYEEFKKNETGNTEGTL